MQKEIYQSSRYFTFFDYLSSHGQLLIRSKKDEEYKSNIDIIFFDTSFIKLFTMLHGLKIKIINKNDFSEYNLVRTYLSYENNNLFEIESGDERYYIAASFFRVFENNLEFNETSLGILHKGRENEIASSC